MTTIENLDRVRLVRRLVETNVIIINFVKYNISIKI